MIYLSGIYPYASYICILDIKTSKIKIPVKSFSCFESKQFFVFGNVQDQTITSSRYFSRHHSRFLTLQKLQ